ncbi:hypothetical protein CIG19_12315 [Enterobacterales bacterium CwR94]|nr:hypothetical protein CIG19_12315 [Enterobacterales bacterium CwR94]
MLSLLAFLIHFWLGPFAPASPALHSLVAGTVSAVKSGVLAGMGLPFEHQTPQPKVRSIDDMLNLGVLIGAGLALVFGLVAGMRKESRWGIYGALILGSAVFAMYAALIAAAIWLTVMLVLVVTAFIAGSLS